MNTISQTLYKLEQILNYFNKATSNVVTSGDFSQLQDVIKMFKSDIF